MKRRWIIFICILGLFCLFGETHAQSTPSSTTPESATTTQPIAEPISPSINSEPTTQETQQTERHNGSYESGRVISKTLEAQGDLSNKIQKEIFEIEIRSGSLKGSTITIDSDLNSNPYRLQPQKGDKIILFIQQQDDGSHAYYLEGFDRRIPLYWIVLLFALTLTLLAGWQGVKVVLSIAISLGLIGWVLIPSFIKGANPIPIAIILAGTFTLVSSGFAFGWNKKTLSTTLGTIGGTLFALAISGIFVSWSKLNGLGSEEDRLFFAQNSSLEPRHLLFAGIIIASMGIVEDVAVSIASGIEQVSKANQRISFKSLFTSGMIIGKDHAMAMANTIIFAYVGASLSTLLLYSQYDSNWLKFLNFDSITEEIIRSLSATIGLILTVPLTAVLSAWFCLPKQKNGNTKKTLVHTKVSE